MVVACETREKNIYIYLQDNKNETSLYSKYCQKQVLLLNDFVPETQIINLRFVSESVSSTAIHRSLASTV